jgi:protein phosphatase
VTTATWTDPASGWTARVGGASVLGNYREFNEDYLLLDPEHPFCLVLDGMGGYGIGDVASRVATEVIRGRLADGLARGEEPASLIAEAFLRAQGTVLEKQRDPDFRGTGATTVVLALLHCGRVFVSWLGDSLAFRVRGGRTERLTQPHDHRTWMVRNRGLSEVEAEHLRGGGRLVYYLGGRELPERIETTTFDPLPGDRLILATDGVWALLEHSSLSEACQSHREPQACAEYLVQLALDHGSRDNCTAAVIAFERADNGPPSAPPRTWWR